MTLAEQLAAVDRLWDHAGVMLARTMMDESIRELTKDRMTRAYPLYKDSMFRWDPAKLNAEAREEVADAFAYLVAALVSAERATGI